MADLIYLWWTHNNFIIFLIAVHGFLIGGCVRGVGKSTREANEVEVCHGSVSLGNRL